MTTRNINDLHPTLKEALQHALNVWAMSYPTEPVPFLTCAYRDNKEQSDLYAQGRTAGKLGKIVTNAKAGQSPHNFLPSFAFDIAFKNKKGELDWNNKLFTKFWQILNSKYPGWITFGGTFKFKDYPHFELTGWKNLIK